MRILSAEFVTSAADGWSVPREADAEVALVGRSNVGKSSLINALARTRVARTSAAPGKTRLANVYRVALQAAGRRRTVYLVDLPGYGYARGGAGAAEELKAVAEAYFGRATRGRRAALLCVDARHPGLEADAQAARWLAARAADWRVVATKVDKLSRAERTRNLGTLERVFGQPPLAASSTTGEGLDALWKQIVRGPDDEGQTGKQ